jgi:hypothetical protein
MEPFIIYDLPANIYKLQMDRLTAELFSFAEMRYHMLDEPVKLLTC